MNPTTKVRKKRGRPREEGARRFKIQVCFGEQEIGEITRALAVAHEAQQDLEPRDRVAPSRLLSELAMLAARHPEMVKTAAAAHRAEHDARAARRAAGQAD